MGDNEIANRGWKAERDAVERTATELRHRVLTLCNDLWRAHPEAREAFDDLAWHAARHAVDVAFGKADR